MVEAGSQNLPEANAGARPGVHEWSRTGRAAVIYDDADAFELRIHGLIRIVRSVVVPGTDGLFYPSLPWLCQSRHGVG